jgi:7-cyano-7-deazaguanine synthase
MPILPMADNRSRTYPVSNKTRITALKTIVICSGGLDSVTLAHKISRENRLEGLVSFDYGQRHGKELDFARNCAGKLGVNHALIDISSIGSFLKNSALTGEGEIPEGHYAEESMKSTVVPNRNAIMLTIAYAIAAAREMEAVAAMA